MSLKTVCSSDGDISRYEKANPHEGWTGFQCSLGSGSSELRSNARAAAAATAMTTRGEKRFTMSSLWDFLA
jgi:hypothetical protein